MDNSIRGATDSVAWRLHCIPCRRRADSLIARVRRDLPDPSFFDGEPHRLNRSLAYSASVVRERDPEPAKLYSVLSAHRTLVGCAVRPAGSENES